MIKDLMTQSWEDIAEMERTKLTVFLGIAPVEEHGRHLPVGVDVYETKEWMDGAVKLLEQEHPGYVWAALPVIPLGFADMGKFPGNIHVSRRLIFDVVLETVSAVAEWGVENIIVISAHADPLHAIAVEQACGEVNERLGVRALAPMGSIFNAGQKGIESEEPERLKEKNRRFSNDFHAGWVETSCMLDLHPEYVKSCYKERPDISLRGMDMMDSRKVADAIKGEGHIGYPKEASQPLGRMLNQDMAEKIRDAVWSFVTRNQYERYEHHPLFGIPGMQLEIESEFK